MEGSEQDPEKRHIILGTREMEFPSADLGVLQDCNHLLGRPEALRREMHDKGYLFIRGLHDREEVLAARLSVLEYIRDSGGEKLKAGVPWQSGVLDSRCGQGCVPFMEGRNYISHHKNVLKVLEGPRPKEFFRSFFGEEALTFDFKWLRGIHHSGFTGAHVDNVYMCRGTNQLCTMWTPFGDVTTDMGTLAVCEHSHRLPGFKEFQRTYGNFDLEKENFQGSGWFTLDPVEISSKFGGRWKTSDFRAGDVLIFTMRTVHMSTVNTTDYVRISCDTRWQPATQKTDDRFMGELKKVKPKFGSFVETDGKTNFVTMEQMKERWGFN